MRLLECRMCQLSRKEANLMCGAVVHSFQVFKYSWYFLIVFSSRHCWLSKEDFLSNAGTCFGRVAVAIGAVLRSLKGKILLRINKSQLQNFSRYESKCSGQNTKVVRFYPEKVAIPFFSGANDRIEIDNFCCLLARPKRLYKQKSLGPGSNSSNAVISIINAQQQFFGSDYSNCKPVEETKSMTY